MAELNNCLLPDDLYYHIEYNVWVRDTGDGTYELGMTDIAQTLAGAVIHCRPKKAGKTVKAGKSLATVESGKWVGPVKAPFTCEIVARNDEIETAAAMLNKSPYKKGWIVRVKPEDGASVLDSLLLGSAAHEPFKVYMAEHELEACVHCEEFDG